MLLSISCAVVTLHSLEPPSKGQSEDRWLQESWGPALLSVTELLLDLFTPVVTLGDWTLPPWQTAVIQPVHPTAVGRMSPAIPAPLLQSAVKRPGEDLGWNYQGFSWWILSCVYISEQLIRSIWCPADTQLTHSHFTMSLCSRPHDSIIFPWAESFPQDAAWDLSAGILVESQALLFLQPLNFNWKQYLKKQT